MKRINRERLNMIGQWYLCTWLGSYSQQLGDGQTWSRPHERHSMSITNNLAREYKKRNAEMPKFRSEAVLISAVPITLEEVEQLGVALGHSLEPQTTNHQPPTTP